jgi:hypothetical protein
MNTSPKHAAQATVASRAWQNEQLVASLAAAAPHWGQVRVLASIDHCARRSGSGYHSMDDSLA